MPSTEPDSTRTRSLDLLLEVVVLLQADMTQALAKLGLSEARVRVTWLLHHGGPCTQRALAEALGTTARNVTGLVDGLEATGFVTREPHPTDRRATHVTLTPHGAGVMARMASEHEQLADQLFGALGRADLASLDAGLEHVVARLRGLLGAS